MSVLVGLDMLQADDFALLRNRRIGLFTNPSAVNRRLESAYHVLTSTPSGQIGALFSAEHGLLGAAGAGDSVSSSVDPRTGITVHSLYGSTYKPTPDMLAGLDLIICDVQDVGARFYTYTWTVSYILEAAGEADIPVMILDRPNPLGGVAIDGALTDSNVASFVGRFPEPIQHGLTLGEHAELINTLWNSTPCDLTVIPCSGWKRSQTWDQMGLTWIPTSPNMPHYSTVQHYTGSCLVEGTNLSEGRGTPLPFEIIGAPFMDGDELANRLNAQEWLGCRFRPIMFTPSASKWAGEQCGGVQVHITEPALFQPIRVWLGVIMAIQARYADQFAWIPESFDRLAGTLHVRETITSGTSLH